MTTTSWAERWVRRASARAAKRTARALSVRVGTPRFLPGVGGFAVVVHGTRRDNRAEVAVKILRMQPGTLRHVVRSSVHRAAGRASSLFRKSSSGLTSRAPQAERPTRHLAVDSVFIESDRKTLEHDVLREIHILKSLNWCVRAACAARGCRC